jgi:hypothetical protein
MMISVVKKFFHGDLGLFILTRVKFPSDEPYRLLIRAENELAAKKLAINVYKSFEGCCCSKLSESGPVDIIMKN